MTQLLSRGSCYSCLFYRTNIIISNFPSEDYLASSFCYLPTHTWSFFGVFDGHKGSATSAFLAQNLANALIGSLADLFSKHAPIPSEHVELGGTESGRPFPPPDDIDRTIKDTFINVDNILVNESVDRAFADPSKAQAVEALAAAHAGSCALVAFYESDLRVLRVALAGDSRAILGRRIKGTDTYEVHVLSHEQNAHNPTEAARMNAAHPGETIIQKGRVLGWGLSRAFGDAAYKWSLDIQERLHEAYLGDRPPRDVKTPPYFTAEPEITTTEIQSGDFLIMASDGLWDCLTNEEVVGLVGVWLKRNVLVKADASKNDLANRLDTRPIVERDELPVELQEDKTQMYHHYWHASKKFINVDNNVAIHLIRNAIGGADRDLTTALLSMNPPRSRRYRYAFYFSRFFVFISVQR